MKTVELNIADRLVLLGLFDNFKSVGSFTSNFEKMAKALDDIKLIGLSEEEKTAAKIVEIPPTETTPGQVKWDPEYTETKTVELNDSTVEFVRAYIADKDSKGEVTLADRNLLHIKQVFA